MAEHSFLGTGMKFPPQVNKSTGRFVLSSGLESIRESIYIILMTQKTERWLMPEFGSGLMSYTFMDTSLTMLGIMSRDLRETILKNEPRISEVDIDVDSTTKEGCLIMSINYTVIDGNRKDNLVFPFYLNAATEESYNGAVE